MVEFDSKAMQEAIAKCDLNIKIFEDAIKKELMTKMEYQRIVRALQEKAAKQEHAAKNIIVDVSYDDSLDDDEV